MQANTNPPNYICYFADMKLSIVIPAHNEEAYLQNCLHSFVVQTRIPDELVVVDDNSTDGTLAIAQEFSKKHSWIKVLHKASGQDHIPGKKVVDTFNFGLEQCSPFDLIGKFDADIILPKNYLETVCAHFENTPQLGMCSGLLFIEKEGQWVYENIANTNHIRGPIKLYSKACFEAIGGLRPGLGWDTVDVLLANYFGFGTFTDSGLMVKHLRPTGHSYSQKNKYAKGLALYRMRYGIPLAKLAALKMAIQSKSISLYFNTVFGYIRYWLKKEPRFVTPDQGKFIRAYRWRQIFKKLV